MKCAIKDIEKKAKLPKEEEQLSWYSRDWKFLLVWFTPVLLLPMILLSQTTESRCGYVILIMSIFYMTEALPLPITALMPVFAFPLMGIVSTNEICMVYMRGTTMVFLGGLVVAIAVEHSNLHKRIALLVIMKIGQSPRQLMASFMATSMFLSMWISNTAAAAMMIPIVEAILQELYKSKVKEKKLSEINFNFCSHEYKPIRKAFSLRLTRPKAIEEYMNNNTTDSILKSPMNGSVCSLESIVMKCEKVTAPDEESKSLGIMFFLAVVYGTNLGGTSFPTGTGPNLVLWGLIENSVPEGTTLDFGTWMAFNIPSMLACGIISWAWLDLLFIRFGKVAQITKKKEKDILELVQKNYKELGSVSYHEKSVLALFILLVVLWIFRAPQFMHGWAELFKSDGILIGNATPAVFIFFVLFTIPTKLLWDNKTNTITPSCLIWDVAHEKIPWGLIILVGGGFAMAEGADKSGLSLFIKDHLQHFKVLPVQLMLVLICLITTFLTEIITNITAASILLPVLKDLAIGIEVHPFFFMIPATVCCSHAFMLPVSNPPNAMAYNASGMRTTDMIKVGFLLKFFSVSVIIVLINTLGIPVFTLDEFPAWATMNQTIATNATF